MNKNKKQISINFISLGCPKNLVDSETLMGYLAKDCFTIVPPDEPAQVTIINTCSFVNDAKEESIDSIFAAIQSKISGHCELIVVTGCLPQRYQKELPTLIPEVDLFIGFSDYPHIAKHIRNKLKGNDKKTFISKQQFLANHKTPRMQATAPHTTYVKISEGCTHQCSFCTIPLIRGNLISRSPDDIYDEIRSGFKKGIKEFNLIAQDLNEYGRDLPSRPSLHQLLTQCQNLEGNFWIRLLYMYPLQFPDKLIALIKKHPHIIKYVDIPLQHINDHMLKSMKRGSSQKYIHNLIEKLKKIDDMVLRTTFIVGHPGETNAAFKELKNFVKSTEFDHVGVFKYSNEENTASHSMSQTVSEEEKEERWHELMSLQKNISLKKKKALIGKTLKVLFEGTSQESDLLYQGRYYGQAPDIDGVVLINSGTAKIGEFCDVEITDAFEYDLLGKITCSL